MERISQRWIGIGTEFFGNIFPDGTMGLGVGKRICSSSEVSSLMRQCYISFQETYDAQILVRKGSVLKLMSCHASLHETYDTQILVRKCSVLKLRSCHVFFPVSLHETYDTQILVRKCSVKKLRSCYVSYMYLCMRHMIHKYWSGSAQLKNFGPAMYLTCIFARDI